MRATRFLALLTALVASVAAGGCDDGPAAAEGEGEGEIDGGTIIFIDAGPTAPPVDGGGGVVDAGPVNTAVYITALSPASGPLGGGGRVIVEGDGYDPSCVLTFGDVAADPETCILLTRRGYACQVPAGVEPGSVTVTMTCASGIGELEGGYTYFSPITLTAIAPTTGTTEGGAEITFTGASFTPGMLALIDQRQVVALDVADDGLSATALTPPGTAPGRVDVTVIDAFGRSTLARGFVYTSTLSLDTVSPEVVSAGDVIDLFGTGFNEREGALSAAVDDTTAVRDNLISDRRQRVVVPPVGTGLQDVSVNRGAVEVRLADAIVVLGAVTGTFVVSAVVPRVVDNDGGEIITVVGEGFSTATGVSIDGSAATDVVVVDDRRVRARVPAHAAGNADVTVTRADSTTATLTDGVTYAERIRITAVSPNSGEAAGGTLITVTGAGFVDGATTVTLGGVACADVTVVSTSELSCTTGVGAPGLVDVRVTTPAGTARSGEAFLFEAAPAVLGIVPARGAFSGDVVVSIAGAGFQRLQRLATATTPMLVFIGGQPCDPREMKVLSDNLLTTRSPLTDIGVLDVTVALATVSLSAEGVPSIVLSETEVATAVRRFTTFDPTSFLGGTRGGPINGALYVTALDAFTGVPIANALAFTGTDGVPTAADITHEFGQATLSGPEIFGAQTVTVAADGYETSSLVDVNAQEATFLLQPLRGGGGGGGGTPPPPPPPAQVRGRVFGFAKEFFDPAALAPNEIALAIVVTSARDEFGGSGSGGPGSNNNVFEEGGEFFLASTRTGRLALVAIAGIYNLDTDEFRPRQLGIRRQVFPTRGVTLIDQDIELTIPLDEHIDLSLPDAPLDADITDVTAAFGNGPDITRVVPFLQFGGEGAFNYTVAIDADRNHALEGMPDVPGEMLTFIAGAYSTTGRNLYSNLGTASLTANSVLVAGNGNINEWSQRDFLGSPLVIGMVFVAELPDGKRFGSDIMGVGADGSLRLRDRAPVTAAGVAYHIGRAGPPSSEVIQDGVGGRLRGGVTIQPVLGIPEVVTPLNGAPLVRRTMRWRAAVGEQPTIHQMYAYTFRDGGLAQLWSLYIEGSRTKVPFPVVPETDAFLRVLPIAEQTLPETFVPPIDLLRGAFIWDHQAIYVPNLDYANWSFLDLSMRGRRAWTTNVTSFVHGRDD